MRALRVTRVHRFRSKGIGTPLRALLFLLDQKQRLQRQRESHKKLFVGIIARELREVHFNLLIGAAHQRGCVGAMTTCPTLERRP
jgi:hypothetical protein